MIEAPAANYPSEAKAQHLEGTVLLRLTIDTNGHVTAVEVLESVGYGFDESARDAARHFRFEPARKGDKPVTARITLPVRFGLAPEAPVASSPPPPSGTGLVVGKVTIDGAPARSSTIVFTSSDTQRRATTDSEGLFHAELPPGHYDARAARGERAVSTAFDVTAGDETTVDLVLAAEPPPETEEVNVRGERTTVQKMRQSAEAVTVIDLTKARRQTADLGEILARAEGVAIRRDGGLGSETRVSLNGLYDDQVRFFIDGVPLDLLFPSGIADIPVNLSTRIEIYRGVLPIRFGADALGGAINVVTDEHVGTHASASYQTGSFGTYRGTVEGRYRHARTGLFVGGAASLDRAKNNYDVNVEVADEKGRISQANVPRFHDKYLGYNATLETGVVEKPWARRLTLSGYVGGSKKDIQSNLVMKVPYGEPTFATSLYGATLHYDVAPRSNMGLNVVANLSHRRTEFIDTAEWIYDWFGRRIRARNRPGEIGAASDLVTWQTAGFGRLVYTWAISPFHVVRVATTGQRARRTGDQLIQLDPTSRDLQNEVQHLDTLVSGIEYELNLFHERFSNIAFVKDYLYRATSDQPLVGGGLRSRGHDSHTEGAGDSVRFRLTPWLIAKASYEYATRLPTPNEVFGDGATMLANFDLDPEVSHNFNLGPLLDWPRSAIGDLTAESNAFLRDSQNLILTLPLNDNVTSSARNVYRSRILGVENSLSWTERRRRFGLNGTFTYQDARNDSNQGQFKDFDGDRIPNRPYIFGSWGGLVRFSKAPRADDVVEIYYNGRYVHKFYRGWESQGLKQFKQYVDYQVTHNLGVTWSLVRDFTRTSATFEIQNVLDSKVYDNFGVQRPGRAYYVKLTGDI